MSKVAVIGSGVVGEATGKGLTQAGHSVTFVDINSVTLKRLESEGFHPRMDCPIL